ncbi:MAG: NADH-quinone oxidoreductase subunit C [Deltaproteobacteria bacterium]|nr:NADH-quinone oxidoreductase subunit C [Deltaproteobacteria bacterium]MBI3388362.1 NADH-quinone oxidoreductase subunit C [Deltaproteobacteria bacterium]
MDAAAIHQRLKARFGDQVGDCDLQGHDPAIRVVPAAIADVSRFLRDESDLRFDSLSNETGVDYKARNAIEVVYHLYSYKHRHAIVLKVDAVRDNPLVPTVEHVWKAANWLEREIYDLLGVTFEGHTDLRRLLMPEDWVGYPLRKDFVEPEMYHGISTRRESLLK